MILSALAQNSSVWNVAGQSGTVARADRASSAQTGAGGHMTSEEDARNFAISEKLKSRKNTYKKASIRFVPKLFVWCL